jgi:hypothetical protein
MTGGATVSAYAAAPAVSASWTAMPSGSSTRLVWEILVSGTWSTGSTVTSSGVGGTGGFHSPTGVTSARCRVRSELGRQVWTWSPWFTGTLV